MKAPDGDRGCLANTGDHACPTALDDDDFTVGDTNYDVYGLVVSESQGSTRYLHLYLNRKIPDAGSDPSAAWVDAGHTGDGTAVSDEITGLTPLTFYYFRVRAVNDAGNDPWEVVLGIPLPEPHGPLLTPDFDLPVKLTFNDGGRDLPMITTGAFSG